MNDFLSHFFFVHTSYMYLLMPIKFQRSSLAAFGLIVNWKFWIHLHILLVIWKNSIDLYFSRERNVAKRIVRAHCSSSQSWPDQKRMTIRNKNVKSNWNRFRVKIETEMSGDVELECVKISKWIMQFVTKNVSKNKCQRI